MGVTTTGRRRPHMGPAGVLRGLRCASALQTMRLASARRAMGPAPPRRAVAGQMTVELAVALPVLIIVAVIAVNACTFMGDCAVFDRVARQAVRVHAATPAYRQGTAQSCAQIQSDIEDALDADNVDVNVTCTSAGMDMQCFTATAEYAPTLFGLGLRSSVFGVPLPRLAHSTSLVVDVYKPGVVV